jgi:hypothetical protein
MTRPEQPRLWRTGFRAGMVAAIINLALFRFGAVWGVFRDPLVLPNRTDQLSLMPIVAASLGAALLGTLTFQLLSRWLQRPLLAVYGITLGVVLLSSFGPVMMRSWSDQQVLYVNLMHLVVAISTVAALWHWDRTRGQITREEYHDDSNSRTRLGPRAAGFHEP